MKTSGILLILVVVTGVFSGLGFLAGELFKQSTNENPKSTLVNELVLETGIRSETDESYQKYYDIEIKN